MKKHPLKLDEGRYSWMAESVQKMSLKFWLTCRQYVANEIDHTIFIKFLKNGELDPSYGCTIATKEVSVLWHCTWVFQWFQLLLVIDLPELANRCVRQHCFLRVEGRE